MASATSCAAAILEQERHEGQALLRDMAACEKVDWQAIIAKAQELHAREQLFLSLNGGYERRVFVQRQRRALQQRRKYDVIGSFSVNMLTYRMEPGDHEGARDDNKKTQSIASTREDEASLDYSSGMEDCIISPSSSSGMDVIDEQLEAYSSESF